MSEIFADRFVRTRGRDWIDLASGQTIRIRLLPGGPRADELAWSRECERLANLRHPAMNALLDFGTAGRQMFEAYLAGGAHAGGPSRQFLQHVARFLSAQDVAPCEQRAEFLFRNVCAVRGRPLGVLLQRRDVFASIVDALDAAHPAGACAIAVHGPQGSGLRTLQLLLARAARLQGYVPIASAVAVSHRWLSASLGGRHVCVFIDQVSDAPREGVAAFLARLGAAGARRHLVVSLVRNQCQGVRAMSIDPMGVTAMTNMIFIDPDEGPAPDALFAAAREAEGRPGLFLARLRAGAFEPHRRSVQMVHETTPDYVVSRPPREPPAQPKATTRTAGVAFRAADRGIRLARHGRHGAARRVLARATRLLRARGDLAAAATCAQARGALALERGQIDQAIEAFEHARDISPEGTSGILAAIGIGASWIEDGRLIESEAALRNAVVAARSLEDPALVAQAASALARALYWQDRCDEAAAVLMEALDGSLGDLQRAEMTIVSARVHLVEGALAPALRAARAGIQLALTSGDAQVLCSARRVLAAALLVAGDGDGCRDQIRLGLAAAQSGHFPLAAVRLRVVLLDALSSASEDRPAILRLAARLMYVSVRVPRLLRFQIRAACARATGAELGADIVEFIRSSGAAALSRRAGAPATNPVADLEGFLQVGQTASDDRSALERMAEELRQRVRAGSVMVAAGLPERRVLMVVGRPWPGDPQIAWRSLASGCPVPPDRSVEPCQASEPVRYGGQVIGAAACRWTAGTVLETGRAMTLLRFAALAMAPHLRALADQPVVATGESTWKDLLGESDVARTLRDAVVRSARAPFPVLIEGESGSGKELVARAIHRLSSRRDRRFCAINCAALSDDLLEAELFGHARGSFTGAIGDRPGLFEEADGGTLFLDEIGELSARAQAKLLRVLQDGEVRRIGENVPRRVDARIVAATNRRLEHEAAAGRFRPDLRFRLDVVRIDVPPLRARPSDVPLLASHFWTDAASRVGSRATLSPEALCALSRYDWPGNVRELQNVIAWMAVHSPRRGRIGSSGLPAHLARASAPAATTFEAARQEFERRFVKAALASADGHRCRAAQSMGITRQGLAKMLRRLGLDGA